MDFAMPPNQPLDRAWFQSTFSRFLEIYEGCWNGIQICFDEKTISEKVEFMYGLWHQVGLFKVVRPGTSKCISAANNYRSLSIRDLEEHAYNDAVINATKMLAYAPRNKPNLLIIAHNLRSEALFAQQKYALALTDINMCFALYSYDDVYGHIAQEEMLERQAQCFQRMNKDESGRVGNLVRLFQGMEFERASSVSKPLIISKNPSFTNEMLPGASRKIVLKEVVGARGMSARGTYIEAKEEIQPGELLMCAEPYVAKLLPENCFTHCSHCFVRCEILIPCKGCSQNMYCSTTCLESDRDSVHTTLECEITSSYLQPLHKQKLDLLALRLFIKATRQGTGLHKLLQHPIYGKPFVRLGVSPNVPFHPEHYNSIHELEDNFARISRMKQMKYIALAAVYVNVLVQARYFCMLKVFYPEVLVWYPRQCGLSVAERFAGTLLFKYLCIVRCNSYSIMETPPQSTDRISIGTALYTLPSFMTHSCDSHVIRDNSYKNHMYFFAAERIPQGHEITDDYGVQYFDVITRTRQDFLDKRWHFQCNCEACEEKWPTVDELQECDLSILPRLKDEKGELLNVRIDCHKCQRILDQYKRSDDGIDKHWGFFCRHLGMLHHLIKKPWKQYTECQVALRKIIYRRRKIIDDEVPADST